MKEHTVPESARVLNLGCTFERDTYIGTLVAIGGNDVLWIVRAHVDGRAYRTTLHYSAKKGGYSAGDSHAYYATWEYAMERDGVPALIRQMESLARLNGR